MRCGTPSYAHDGEVEIAFASASIGNGHIRDRQPEQVNLDAVAQLLQATAASDGAIGARDATTAGRGVVSN